MINNTGRRRGVGGALAAIESGYIQREIQESVYRYQRAVDQKEQIVVGVNEFTVSETAPLRLLKVGPAVRGRRKARLVCPQAAARQREGEEPSRKTGADSRQGLS